MGYRFQTLSTLYPQFAKQFLEANPNHRSMTFSELHRRLIATRYWWSDFFSRHIRALGNEAQDLFVSLKPLQYAWAKEKGLAPRSRSWLYDIALAQVEDFKPDVILLQDLYLMNRQFRTRLRQVCRPNTLIFGWRSAPTTGFSELNDLDLVLSAFPHFVEELRVQDTDAAYLPLAFEPSLLDEIDSQGPKDLSFTFVGQIGRERGPHEERLRLVTEVMGSTPLEVWSAERVGGQRPGEIVTAKLVYRANRALTKIGVPRDPRAMVPLLRRGATWERDPTTPTRLEEDYPDRFHRPVFGLAYYEILARSKLTLNSHIDAAEEWASNMRMYEATGTGTCLVTDWKPNLHKLFDLDHEVVAYRTAEECVEKVLFLLDHDAEREKIARAGQRRTLTEHTYTDRAARLNDLILERLG